MSKLGIYTGSAPDAGDGDSLLVGAVKINSNFDEIYNSIGDGTSLTNTIGYASTSGISTLSQGLTGAPDITVGVVTASSLFVGVAGSIITTKDNFIGVGTTVPTSMLTVGGDLLISGITTSSEFVGIGSGLTNINAINISLGTLDNARLPSNISVTEVTASNFYGSGENLTGIVTYITSGGGIAIDQSTGNVTIDSIQYWSSGVGIHTLSNVGIGTTNPNYYLEIGPVGYADTSLWVNGNARVSGILTVGSSSIILDGTDNIINVGSGVTIYGDSGTISLNGTTLTGLAVTYITAGPGILLDSNVGEITISTLGNPTQWETTGVGIHTLSNVGIGTTTASSALTVKGNTSLETLNVTGVSTFNNLNVTGVSTFQNDIKVNYNKGLYFGNGNEFLVYRYDGLPNDKTVVNNASGDFQITSTSGLSIDNGTYNYAVFDSSGTGLYHTASDIPAVTLRYQTTDTGTNVYKDFSVKVSNGNDLFVVKSPGSGLSTDAKVGIGTTNPTNTLTVRGGDISVGVSTAHGVILTSPNGTQYRLIVDDSGNLSTVSV